MLAAMMRAGLYDTSALSEGNDAGNSVCAALAIQYWQRHSAATSSEAAID